MTSFETIYTLGPAVFNEQLSVRSAAVGAKRDCTVIESLGGGAAGAAEAIRQLDGDVVPVLFTGPDSLHLRVSELVERQFPGVACLPWLEQTRRSVILDDAVYTVRSELQYRSLTPEIAAAVGKARMTVIAPMSPADYGFVRSVIAAANRSVLLMSEAQLLDQDAAFSLAAAADLVVLNDREGRILTGRIDPAEMIAVAHERGVKQLIVTEADGATMSDSDGECVHVPAFEARRIDQTVGAGDHFVAGLVLRLSEGSPLEEAVRFGHAVALLWVEAGSAAINREAAEEVLAHRRQAERVFSAGGVPQRVRAVAVQFAVAAGLLLGAGLGVWL
jgi:sugar/nucleoside kinase (ribokinase family)